MLETETNYYMTYLDFYGYNHVVKYDKSFNVIANRKFNKVTDSHGQLDIQVDINGRLHIIGGGHTDSNNYYYLEKTKGSFEFYENNISVYMTYPKLYCKGQDMYLFYRDSNRQHANEDRWCLVKSNINTQTIDFSNKEQITETTFGTTLAGYGQTTMFNGDEFVMSCNWYDGTIGKGNKGFFIKKNLITGKWYNINNSELTSLPLTSSYSDFTGDDFRQSQIAYMNSAYYFFKSEMSKKTTSLAKIDKDGYKELKIDLPADLYINGFSCKNGLMYCLSAHKTKGDVMIHVSDDEFATYKSIYVGDFGNSYYWSSCTMNVLSDRIIVRILKDTSNLLIKVIDL